jgi:hypothetical protein
MHLCKIPLALSPLVYRTDVLLVNLEIHRDSGGLDRDTALFFVRASIHESYVSSLRTGNDTSLGNQRIG